MTTEKMSLHRALGELKTLESRIMNELASATFVRNHKKIQPKIDGMEIGDYEDKVIKSSYQKVTDLIDRRKRIKDALTKANATISFDLNGETFTIATAIDRKNAIEIEKSFLGKMNQQYRTTLTQFNNSNENLTRESLEEAQKFFVGKDSIDTTKIKILQDEYIKQREVIMIDPLDVKSKIDALNDDLVKFESEIDYKLSELNATNFIEI